MIRLSRLAAAAAFASVAAAAPPEGRLPLHGVAPGARLVPGVRVEAEWPAGLPGDEGELLLSLDDGRTFPLRLTAEAAPGSARLVFRVPNLPSEGVRVALRTGSEAGGEAIRAVSVGFGIASAPAAALEPLFSRGGELLTREAAGAASLPSSSLDPAAPSLAPLGGPLDGAEAPAAAPPSPPSRFEYAAPAPAPLVAARSGARRANVSDPKRE